MRQAGLPPGPRYPALIQAIGFWTRPLAVAERSRSRYGKRYTIRLPLAPPFVMLSDPGEVKEVFTAPADVLHPGEGARILEPVVGSNSVVLLDGDAHMEQRRLMLSAFHGEKMSCLEQLMAEVAAEEISGWPRGRAVALHPRMQRLTLEIILRAVFGLDRGARLEALRDRLSAMLAFGDRPISLVPPSPDGLAAKVLERVGPFAAFARLQGEADEMIFELIRERRAGSNGAAPRDGAASGTAFRGDVLAMLLEARHEDGSPMSGQELRDELMTLLVAGHETTASTLAWALARLPRHLDVVARLRAEAVSGDDAYLTATIQEVLRRRPVLPNAAPRLVKTPVEIGGRRYPAGVALVPATYLIHHDPALYPDPYEFRPERFVDEKPGTYTWIPFGGGRRRCLGASFAMVEMKIVLRAILDACDLSPAGPPEQARRRNITIRPARAATVVLGDTARAPREAVAA